MEAQMALVATRPHGFLLAVITSLLVLGSVRAQGQTPMTSTDVSQAQVRGVACGTSLTIPGRYALGSDLNCSGTAITISGSGVELSLAGHRISGANLDVGIQVDLLGGGRIL